jgi:hypothetical protein
MSVLSNPTDKKAIRDALREISQSLTRVEGERDYIKESIKAVSEKYLIPKKTLRRMAKVYHNQNYNKEQEEFEEFETLYETIVEGSGNNAET